MTEQDKELMREFEKFITEGEKKMTRIEYRNGLYYVYQGKILVKTTKNWIDVWN